MNAKVKIPSVLGIRRALIVSDGVFYGVNEDEKKKNIIPVIRHGIRGTQNQGKGADDVSNVQRTESAKTFHDSRFLLVSFSFRPLPLMEGLTSCSGVDAKYFREAFECFVEKSEDSAGLQEVCRRIARNVFNGRWLWRNRQFGTSIIVTASMDNEVDEDSENTWHQDALKTPLNHFDNYTDAEVNLGNALLEQFSGGQSQSVQVTAEIDLGMTGSVEVYPSQNYVQNKPKGFARPLYKLDIRKIPRGLKNNDPDNFEDTIQTGIAALRDQKIWNALRTLDTWYVEYAETGLPIPIEPLGANLSANVFYRTRKSDTLFDMLPSLGFMDPDSDEGMFMIASLIRGGVLGLEDAEKKAEKAAKSGKSTNKKAKNEAQENDPDSGSDVAENDAALVSGDED